MNQKSLALLCLFCSSLSAAEFAIEENEQEIRINSSALSAAMRKQGYVTGIAGGSFIDKKTGFKDAGFGLDIVDWIMEPGSDEDYRDQLTGDLKYEFNNAYHGKIPKRSIEGPQICTQAKLVDPTLIRGADFVAVQTKWKYTNAAPGKKAGSVWTQNIVFPAGTRYVITSDAMDVVNASDAMFFRLDMPGHIKHTNGNSFSEIYLSYHGRIPASAFTNDFAPDEKFLYQRGKSPMPQRIIRAYRLREPKTGKEGPWLAGMTLNPDSVYEAWCHQRGYVCMIQEIGGRKTKPGDRFGAAFIVGYFDTIGEMEAVYDRYKGANGLHVSEKGWKLSNAP